MKRLSVNSSSRAGIPVKDIALAAPVNLCTSMSVPEVGTLIAKSNGQAQNVIENSTKVFKHRFNKFIFYYVVKKVPTEIPTSILDLLVYCNHFF